MGSTEVITIDDFGVTFTVASLSPHGCKWNPMQRMEGPLFFCHLPALVMPQTVVHSCWDDQVEEVAVHVINAYITLLPPHQRRSALLKKEKEDKAATATTAAAAAIARPSPIYLVPHQYTGPAHKKSRPNPAHISLVPSSAIGAPGPQRPGPQPSRPQQDIASMREEMLHLHAVINRLQSQIVPTPALPASRNPTWPRTNRGPDLPDTL